jgi:hypothetical protein
MKLKKNKHSWHDLTTYPGTEKSERELFYPVEIAFYFTKQKVKYFWNNQFKERMVASFYIPLFVCFSTIEFILENSFYLVVDFLNESRSAVPISYFKNDSSVHDFSCLRVFFNKVRYSK